MVVGTTVQQHQMSGPLHCTDRHQGQNGGRGEVRCLFPSAWYVNHWYPTNIQASKSHLHATALSLLASPTHRALQGSVPAPENAVVQGTLRELRAILEQRLKHVAHRHSDSRM